MKSSPLKRREFLASALAMAAPATLIGQANGAAPPGPSGPIAIKSDRPTLLLGDEASIAGNPKPGVVESGAKRLQVRNWTAAEESFSWQVNVPESGEFLVTALTRSKGATLALVSGDQRLERHGHL